MSLLTHPDALGQDHQPAMPPSDPIIYLNGHYTPKSLAAMSVDERGTFYADGVYEVIRYYAGQPFALDLHVKRLRRSLERVRIAAPDDFEQFPDIVQLLLDQNQITDARVYWQITRGSAPRNALFPKGVKPTVLVTVTEVPPLDPAAPVPCLSATVMPDERWANCWIKSLMLLPNILAANAAHDAGFNTAILQRDGIVTEATNANTLIVQAGRLWTHPADRWILNGVTRQIMLQLADDLDLTVHEDRFTTDQLQNADEVLLTGTTLHVAAVTRIDEQTISNAKPGPITQQLHQAFIQRVTRDCLS